MTGLVEQIQHDAMDTNVPVSSLLRKVKVAAVKLGLDDALTWVERELGGYKAVSDLPDYRRGHGETVALNPYQGWQALDLRHPEVTDMVSSVYLFEPVANYEALLVQGDGPFRIALPSGLAARINNLLSFEVPRIANEVPRGAIVNVVQQVRDRVLDWSLELSRAGITGEGIGFTVEEQKKASAAHITIGTLNGSFNTGDATGPNARISQGSTDNSSNIAADSSVFGEIEQAVRTTVTDATSRDALLRANSDMRQAGSSADFMAAYHRFISSAADHMTVIAPFLPALANLMAG